MSSYAWCIKMRDNAPAYHYQQLAQMWREKEGAPCNE